MALASKITATDGTSVEFIDRTDYEKVWVGTTTNLDNFKTPGTYVFYTTSQSGTITKATFGSPDDPSFPCILRVDIKPSMAGTTGSNQYLRHYQKFAYLNNGVSTGISWQFARVSTYSPLSTQNYAWGTWSGNKDVYGILNLNGGDLTTSTTWDGAHTSLKAALSPEVVSDSSINLNDYTTSGKYILTGSITTKTNFPIAQPGYLEVITWFESSTNYFCRQDFKRYDTTGHQNDTFTRIANSTNSGTSWTWSTWRSATQYLPGESTTIKAGTRLSGHVTNSTKWIMTGFWLPKSFVYTNGVTKQATVKLSIRQNGKYIDASGDGGTSFTWGDYNRSFDNFLGVTLSKSSAYTNATNNDDCSIEVYNDITFTWT